MSSLAILLVKLKLIIIKIDITEVVEDWTDITAEDDQVIEDSVG